MKKRFPTFLSGMLTMALIGGLGVTALAATGQMTITVDPINIQVNGQTFQPKDANGADVPVFAYNGTTYAPLRALAEAYGLTVGYDQEANMVTVGDPATDTTAPDTNATTYSDWTAEEEAAYQEFKGMWEIKYITGDDFKGDLLGNVIGGPWEAYSLTYTGPLQDSALQEIIDSAVANGFANKLASEMRSSNITVELRISNGPIYMRTITVQPTTQG